MSRGEGDPTDPETPVVNLPQGVVKGEAVPPDEHTMRVRARQKEKLASNLKVHDVPPPPPEQMQSSSELAEQSRRQRRRERDRRAERRAMQMVVFVFLGLGGAAFVLVNAMIEDEPPYVPPPVDPNAESVVPPPPPPTGIISTKIDETPDIPAFQHLRDTGLTIAAEGIPQVDALEAGSNVAALAALETCRFAYAVWEFSPNKRFRFMTTCGALEGQVMFGAYEIDGAVIRMSPLVTDTDVVVSEFHVEKPSKMVSRVSRSRSGPDVLTIEQKVTAMRPGLDGDAWRDAYAPRNTIHLPSEKQRTAPSPPSSPPPPPPPSKKGDPLLELLKQ